VSIHLRWTIRVVAILNITLSASDLLFPRHSPSALFLINIWTLWFAILWATLTSILLPIFALIEIGRLNDANRTEELRPVLIDTFLAFGRCLFLWGTMLWEFKNSLPWI
jgi:hypothetical protein